MASPLKDRNQAWVLYGTDLLIMAKGILEAAQVASRIPSKNARIALKPNLVLAAPADRGATTHPELVAGAIEYLQGHGFYNLVIAEGSWVGERTPRAFQACGYQALAQRYGVELLDTQRDETVSLDCGGMPLRVCACTASFQYLINLPVLKGHCQTKLTCALKNLKGLLPDSEKRRFHTLGLSKPIAHLNAGLRQDFILVDALCGDLDFEEGGNPVRRDQVLGFLDPVLCDAYACEMLGYEVDEVPYIGLAEKLGVGSGDTARLRLAALNRPASPAGSLQPTRRVQALARHIRARDACSACYGNLIHALKRLEEEGTLGLLPGEVSLGQGFKGCQGELGVGACCGGFAHTVAGCPPTASAMYRMLAEPRFPPPPNPPGKSR